MTYVLGEINCILPSSETVDGITPSTETLSCLVPSYDSVNLFAYGETGEGGGPVVLPPVITLAALPYARTVAMGAITISGTATETPDTITWTASPSGETGTVTGDLTNWSTTVAISPDAAGEGVETITFTATNSAGSDTDSVTIGFYVAGAHTFLNAQNINGNYNSGMVDNDAVVTWENLGSSGLDFTQGVVATRPTYRSSFVNGQPVVKGDGGDWLSAVTASDWRFMHEDTVNHVYGAAKLISGTTQIGVYGTRSVSIAQEGTCFYTTISNDRISRLITNASAVNSIIQTPSTVAWPEGTQWYDYDCFHDGTLGSLDGKLYINNTLIQETSPTAAYSSGTGPTSALVIMAGAGGNRIGAQEWFVFLVYNGVALNSAQRTINHAVTEWALGGALPLTA